MCLPFIFVLTRVLTPSTVIRLFTIFFFTIFKLLIYHYGAPNLVYIKYSKVFMGGNYKVKWE